MVAPAPKPRGHRFKDIEGQRFGRLVAVRFLRLQRRANGFRTAFWLCRCQCGNTTEVDGNKLRNGHTQSCGCLQKERTSAHRKTHGMSHTATYQVWCGMIKRCENPRSKGFSNYGGRGIKVCERWRNSFEAFLKDMGPRPSSRHSIDRINSDGDYEPGNCRWATAKQQARNLRTNRLLTCRGQSKTLAEWAEERRIHSSTITRRIDFCGWSEEEAILTPVTGAGRG